MLLFIFISSDVYYEEVAEGTIRWFYIELLFSSQGVDIFLLVIRYMMSFLRSVIMIKKYARWLNHLWNFLLLIPSQNKGIRAHRDKIDLMRIDLRDVSDDEKRETNTFSQEIDMNLSDDKSF